MSETSQNTDSAVAPDWVPLTASGWRPYHVPGRWIDPQNGCILKTFEAIKEQERRDLRRPAPQK